MSEESHKESKHKLKKLVKFLKGKKGRHTEMVTVYVPAGYSLNEITSQLKQEQGTAENIKSKPVRKNVVTALEKIMRHIQLYKQTPENGLALFAGNISEKEGGSDIELWAIEPPEAIKTKLYWCDQNFVLEPLEKMVEEKEVYGIINLDKSEGDIAILRGKKIQPIAHFESIVPGKTRAGGQCLASDTLVQMSDGSIKEINKIHNPQIVKSADFLNVSIKDTPVLEKWDSEKTVSYIIKTKSPAIQIESSKDHIFFKWGNTIEEVAAEDLKEGDFLLIPEKINIEGKIQNLENSLLYNSYKINDEGRLFLKKRRESLYLFQKSLAKKTSVTQTAISVIELGKRDIKIDFLERLCESLDINPESFIRQYCNPITDLKLPDKLDERLAEFIGYFAGDGSYEKERLSLHDADKQTIKYYNNMAKNIFNCNSAIFFRKKKNYYTCRIYGKPVVNLLKKEFPELKYSGNTLIPDKILLSPDSVLAAFLRGFFDAEGYVSIERGIGLGINNDKLARQIQLSLLRFGILASLHEYDNRRNPYSDNHRFTISITEGKSIELFLKEIGFNVEYKQRKLVRVLSTKSDRSNTRQIFLTGENVRKIIESEGFKMSDFPRVSNFFRNKRMMGKETFRNSVLKEIESIKNLHDKLKIVMDYNLIPVKILSIKTKERNSIMSDIEVKNSNFIANGLVVHNSSQRFSRVREGMLNDWLKHIGEASNKVFEEHKEVLGIIVSGPGPIKDMFLKEDYMQTRFKDKVIGTVDTSYTGEPGLHETVERAGDILKEASVTKEKLIIQNFFSELQKTNGLATYGIKEVSKALEMGAVDTVIISEEAEFGYIKYECQCGEKEKFVSQDKKKQICDVCNSQMKIIEEKDIVEFFEDEVKKYGSKIIVVSTETREGIQFHALGGIGAILRYRI